MAGFSPHGTERGCNWCGPSALADSDPNPDRLCVAHQAAYYERRNAEDELADQAWWSDTVADLLRHADAGTLAYVD